MGLDYLTGSTSFPLLNRINFLKTACHSHFFTKSDFSLTFQVLSKFPWPSTKFPDISLTWKKFIFQIFFPDRGNPEMIETVERVLQISIKRKTNAGFFNHIKQKTCMIQQL